MGSFDKFSNNYREIHNKNLKITGFKSDYFAKKKIEIIDTALDLRRNLKILDLGCGDGKLEECITLISHASVTGIDISKQSINRAMKKNLANCTFVHYDGQYIPFNDNCFDVVIISQVMHHIEHTSHMAILNEVNRVLKPSGNLFIFEHNPINPFTMHIVNTCSFDTDAKLLPFKYLNNILFETGYKKIETFFSCFFPNIAIFKILVKYEHLLKKIPIGGQYWVRCIKKKDESVGVNKYAISR